jgi:hypothetical protein
MRRPVAGSGLELLVRIAAVIALTVSGFIHAKLYVDGYHVIHVIGAMFLLQASASFALALLLLLGGPPLIRVLAAGAAAGALTGFLLSRTVGVFGFSETGWQPAPDSLVSVLVELATLALLLPALVVARPWSLTRA